ncbi:MAG: SDR family oxidoreductase [Gammaproteobacteria bacterium]|nr:SDR family oxidoreductase [Gammaproteobacteria bacterium]
MTTQHTALITGASSGLGAEFARQLAAEGHQLVLVARRLDRLEDLIVELQTQYPQRMEAISCDLAEVGAVAELMDEIATRELSIDILINNAGYSPKESFSQQTPQVVQAQLQVMVNTVTELCHAVLPYMTEKQWGRIINVSSLAAFAPPGKGTMYSAIKQYVLSFSQSLDMDVRSQGIRVTALCPGFTHTEFHDVMNVAEKAKMIPEILWSDAADVVSASWKAVNSGQVVCMPGTLNNAIAVMSKRLPERVRYALGRINPLD